MDNETFHINLEGLNPLQIGTIVQVKITAFVGGRTLDEAGILKGYSFDSGTNTLRYVLGHHPDEGTDTGSLLTLDDFMVTFITV